MTTSDPETLLLHEIRDAAIAVAESTIGLDEADPSWHTGPRQMIQLRQLLRRYHDEFCPECAP